MFKTISFAIFLFIGKILVHAEEEDPTFTFGDTTFFGSGCPEDTVQIIKSSDEQTVSVLFSEYIAETDESSKRDRLSCNLAVPVDVKPGFSIGIYKVDYRGFADVANDAKRDYAVSTLTSSTPLLTPHTAILRRIFLCRNPRPNNGKNIRWRFFR